MRFLTVSILVIQLAQFITCGNTLNGADPRIVKIIAAMNSSFTQDTINYLASNQSIWGPIFDAAPPEVILANCQLGLRYYNYLEDQLVIANDSWVTIERLQQVVGCKQDCNFKRLLSVDSWFSVDREAFIMDILPALKSDVASQCIKQFPDLAKANANLKPEDLVNSIHKISFMTPDKIGKFSPDESLLVAKKLTNSSKKLSPAMAKSLGKNIAPTEPLDDIYSIASSVPLNCFNNTDPSTLANLVGKMDLDNMNGFRKGFIAAKIASSNDPAAIKSLLSQTTDRTIINSIPASLINSLGIDMSSISPNSLPRSYQKSFAKNALTNQTLGSITDSDTLSRILPGITKKDINKIPDELKKSTFVNMLNASMTSGVALASNQRSAMLNSLLTSFKAARSYPIETNDLAILAPLFLEANDTVLAAFSQMNLFGTVISTLATMTASDCCAYSRFSRALFASYAAPYLFNYTSLALSDLAKLGPCIASALSNDYLSNIDPTTFVNYFTTLGEAFQPDDTQIATVQSLIATYAGNATVMASTTQETLAFTTLSDLALFYPFSTYANNISTWSENGDSLMSTLGNARDPSIESIQLCQIGLTNSDSISNLIDSFGSTFISNYVAATSSKKRRVRRSASQVFACTDLTTLGSAISSLTVDQLGTINQTEFVSCQTLLGSTTWTTEQLVPLVAIAKKAYPTISSISDTNIIGLNSILIGFTTTDLAPLVFTTTSSINALGALNGWSVDQLTNGLATPLTTYISSSLSGVITSDFLTSAANLLCCLTSTQITGLDNSVFTQSISTLSKISLTCPNIANWYNYARASTTYGSSLVSDNSMLTELGAILSGITPADIALIPSDSISSIATVAWKYMPADTVNSLSASQISELSNDQMTALLNSPNYASFSSLITSSLQSQLGITTKSSGYSLQLSSISLIKLLIGLYSVLFLLF